MLNLGGIIEFVLEPLEFETGQRDRKLENEDVLQQA